MEQMTKKHNETGRSMVEMLGVLAVVGVLSIGGVAGYRYAVDKMNANEIINELKKRAITASQQRVLSQNINLSEYGAILGKYEVTPANDYPEDPAFFGLEIKAVPQKVCQHIVDSDWALPTEMKIGNLIMDRDTECPDEFNDMIFAFNNTLGSGDFGNGETPDVTTEATIEVTAAGTEVSETDEIVTDLEFSDSISEPEESVSEEDDRCGEHGTWQSGLYGGCYCDSGWAGMYCDIDISCSGHGWWSGDALHCQCDPGWSGRSCEDHVDVCNERGNFVSAFYEEQSTCWCNEGWTGTHCEISTCSGHGSWCGTACTCDRGWSGTFCSNNLDMCNGRGYWQNRSGGDNSCECDTGWTGTYCEVGTCNGKGTWNSSTKTCTCSTGWTGTYCDTSTCYGHGTWNSSTKKCTCSTGWTGTYCDTSTCSGHGRWNASTKTCTCSTGWTGTYCDASTCNGYGTWNGSACECSAGWGGTYCSLPCSGNGSWVEDACSCQAGWAGNDCSIDLCVHGSWVEDGCSCVDGWSGSDCSIPT